MTEPDVADDWTASSLEKTKVFSNVNGQTITYLSTRMRVDSRMTLRRQTFDGLR